MGLGHERERLVSVLGGAGTAGAAAAQVPLPPGPPVVDIDMHDACHALALRADGSVLSWGCDFFGQAGDGENPTDWIVETPTVISMPGRERVRHLGLVLELARAHAAEGRHGVGAARDVGEGIRRGRDGRRARRRSLHDQPLRRAAPRRHGRVLARRGTAGGDDLTLGDGTATIPAGPQRST